VLTVDETAGVGETVEYLCVCVVVGDYQRSDDMEEISISFDHFDN